MVEKKTGAAGAQAAPTSLGRLLRPRSLALVGASAKPLSPGGNVLENLDRFGFAGELYLVSRNQREIGGRACHSSIDDLPAGLDAAVLVVPAEAVSEALAACARRGIGGAVVFASGFGETGAAGRAREQAICAEARTANMALLGPNCLGLVNFVDGVPLTFEPLNARREARAGVCIIAQSGAMAGNIRLSLLARGVPVSFSISTGNEALIGAEDLIEELLEDPAVSLFSLFVEQIRRPARFLSLCARASANKKPIVLMHSGRSERAREAAKSHTGAMTGDYAAMRCMVEREAVVLVATMDELFDTSALLARYPSPLPLGAAMMTNSGALCGFALDFCEDIGLPLPPLGAETIAELRNVLPEFASIGNPLDITAQGMIQPEIFGNSARALLRDPAVGAVLVAAMGGSPKQQMAKWRSLRPAFEETTDKTVALALLGDDTPLADDVLAEIGDSGVPFFRSPDRALRAFASVCAYGRALARPRREAPAPPAAPASLTGRGALAEYRGKAILVDLGIAVPQGGLARDLAEALTIAERIAYPVVLKAQAAALTHKSDAGGVIVSIGDPAALQAAWERLRGNLAKSRAGLALDGILVERHMAAKGLEMIVGAKRDPGWGPLLMVGLGGIFAEALGDVRLMPADNDVPAIEAEIGRLKGAPLLAGYRGEPPLDVSALARAAARIGDLLRADPRVREIDINPLMVYPRGQGVLALDALLVLE